MILNRLYELAEATGLLSDPSIVRTPVAFAIKVGRNGEYRGLADYRERIETPSKSNKPPKIQYRGGLELAVPVRPIMWGEPFNPKKVDAKTRMWRTNDAAVSKGQERPAVFLADTLPRLLPMDSLLKGKDANETRRLIEKSRMQRSTFWRFIEYAAEQCGDDALQALAKLAPLMREPTLDLRERVEADLRAARIEKDKGLCTLAWTPDTGPVLERPAVLDWWRQFYDADRVKQEECRGQGWCQVTRQLAPVPEKIEFPIEGLKRINCRAKAYLVVGLDSASSYGLKLASSCRISAVGIEGFTRAIHMLNENRLPSRSDPTRVGGIQTSFDVGRKTLFLFWTRDRESTGLELLNPSGLTLATPDQFDKLLRSLAEKTANAAAVPLDQQDQFRVLVLSGNSDSESARVFVRDYLEGPLPRLQQSVLKWFADLRIADTGKEFHGQPRQSFTMGNLTAATVPRKSDNTPDWAKLSSAHSSHLMRAALTGGPLSDSLLAACLRRIRAEGSTGFRPARMALLKLILLRKEIPVTTKLNADELKPAYLHGRLLEVFAQIQYAALGDVNANVVDKFYGTYSAAPAMVFGGLVAKAQKHLRKIREEKPATHHALEKRMTEIRALLTAAPPPAQFTLQEQARFALGYYHEKAKRFEEIAKKKAEKARKAAAARAAKTATENK